MELIFIIGVCVLISAVVEIVYQLMFDLDWY